MATRKSLITQSVSSPLDLKVVERPIPDAAPGTAVVQILAAVIGSGHGYLLSHPVPGFTFPVPGVYGSNAVGRVVAAGPDAAALEPGQLVLVDSVVQARDDPNVMFLQGLMNDGSPPVRKLADGVWRDGFWQSHAVVPLENATPLDEDRLLGRLGYTVPELTYISRFAVAYGAMSTGGIKAGETVIIGPASGHFGGAAVELASAMGARVIALGRTPETLAKLKAAVPRVETVTITGDVEKDTQAILAFGLADAFIDYTPHGVRAEPSHIRSAMMALRRRGRMILMGGLGAQIAIPYFMVMLKSIEIKGRWMYTREELRQLVKMAETGVLKLGRAAGHETKGSYQLEDYEAALAEAAKQKAWGKQCVFTP
ncbi:NAD(P)-binding protein [Xylariomycetidae sp. FL2044]|nr:NAD(P)-binding protein [Xylariomycetidae sp. FL2044]